LSLISQEPVRKGENTGQETSAGNARLFNEINAA
jgi:hypothetical protein